MAFGPITSCFSVERDFTYNVKIVTLFKIIISWIESIQSILTYSNYYICAIKTDSHIS